ncbi:hypothetical protein V8C37DRAFT_419449 [Trichoderma ceciliae]
MHLLHEFHPEEDFFLPSPGSEVFGWQESTYNTKKVPDFSAVEAILPATKIQQDIFTEQTQCMPLDTSLRSYLKRDSTSGDLKVVILRRVEGITWQHPYQTADIANNRLAHMTIEGTENPSNIKLVLHFHRGLVDTTSLGFLRFDLALLLHGHPGMERAGFTMYTRFLKLIGHDAKASKSFWSDVLAKVAPSAVFAKSPVLLPAHSSVPDGRRTVSTLIDDVDLSVFDHFDFSRQTIFEVIWALVLSAHTSSDEVIFGTVRRDTSFIGADSCVGCLDHTYFVKIHASRSYRLTIRDVAESLDQFHNAASPHSFVGLGELQRSLPDNTSVETAINYTRAIEASCLASGLAKFPVVLSVSDSGVLRVALKYRTYIPSAEAELILQHFVAGVRSAASKVKLDSCLLTSINLMSEDEQRVALENSLSRRSARPTTISALFEKAVELYPSRTALNSKANAFARLLKLKKGTIVPILAERSVELIIAILSVLKSGAAYTVLDPSAPAQRNAQIINDCAPPTILASRQYDSLVTALSGTDNSDNGNLGHVEIDPEDRCYIIYTSGSTGKPKGAILTHRAATSGMAYHSLNGLTQRTLVMASRERLTGDVASAINAFGIDALGITPSALSLLRPGDIPRVKQITLVGEQIPQTIVDVWAASLDCTQLNFGRALHSSMLDASNGFDLNVSNPRIIGNPADTTDVFILQSGTTELAPLLLAEGYLNEEELSSRVFVDNPFGPGKLYRTGDIGRRLANGMIEILGRADMQVKINGQKVEPAEIDRVLLDCDTVEASVTFAVDMEDRIMLVACVALASQSTFRDAVAAAKHLLRERLPAYMIPGLWLPVHEIPKNANGKVNLHQLRSMARELGAVGFANLMAGEDGQSDAAWASVLAIETTVIRRYHSLIDLGGSSIQAIKVVSELRNIGVISDFSVMIGDASLETVASASKVATIEEQQEPDSFALIKEPRLLSKLSGDDQILDAYPTTAFQQAMLTSVNTPSDPYTYSRVWDVSGLNIQNLRESFEEVFKAREILRTVFVPHKKSFIQVIRDDLTLPWVQSLKSLSSFMENKGADQWDMDMPLFRLTVFSSQVLVVTMHHSLFDFWSYGFIYNDVAAVYLGNALPKRPSFKTFVRYLLSQDETASDAFWSSYLDGAQTLRLNYAPMASPSKIQFDMGFSLGQRARDAGVSLGGVVYSAWAVLLSHHLSTDDVVFATTLSGREIPVLDIQDIDGPTMTTVPQRIKLNSEDSLLQLTKGVMAQFAELAKYSQAGMQRALRAGNLSPDTFDSLVNILMNNNGSDSQSIEAGRVFKKHGDKPIWGSEFTVLEVEETLGTAEATIVRLSSTMELRRLEFLRDTFVRTVEAILEEPSAKLGNVKALHKTEYNFLSETLSNRSTLHIPKPELLHAAFERYAKNSPLAVAIDFNGEEQVSYAELDRRANRFAHVLRSRGLQTGDMVPLMLDKSVDMMVAILGVMKAGGAYIPLSPDNPIDRNSYIVTDTLARLIVAHREYQEFSTHINDLHGVQTLAMMSCSELDSQSQLDTNLDTAPSVNTTPDNLAYCIYTSGSTGNPKGVKVPHRSAAAAVTSMAIVEGRFEGTWRTLQFANYVFDASVQDFFNTLSTGGTLCMAPTDTLLSDIVGCINQMDARQSIITPTVAKLFKPQDVPRFEKLIVGGEPLSRDVVETWGKQCQILNVYGPTETSMVVTTKDVDRLANGRIGNIGAPFPTVMAFIVDPNGEALRPYGAVGELCISGPQVTEGYVNRPDLTSASYMESHTLGVRIYRTGDLARWLPGGEIECLGRKDNQVKLHGHRIELGEIENAIRRCSLVKDVVTLIIDVRAKSHLVAFCIFNESAASEEVKMLDPSLLRDHFAELRDGLGSLATYMVPKFVVPMGAFPKLPSRKVDRKTLKKIAGELSQAQLAQCVLDTVGSDEGQHDVVPVETAAEEVLEQMWADIFGLPIDQIGRTANFLTLGGDSISAISLASQARQAGYALMVPSVLKFPVLKDLAVTMKKTETSTAFSKRVFTTPERAKQMAEAASLRWDDDVEYVYPCPPGQAEFLQHGARDSQMWVLQTVRRMPTDVNQEDWINSTTSLTQVNDILRTTWLQVSPGDWVGVVLRSSRLDLVQMTCETDEEASQFIESFWEARFEFGRPFVRYALLTYKDNSWDLVIKMDHAVYDGTLLRVFDDHYGAILRSQPVPQHVEFREFAQHIFQTNKSADLEYWAKNMAGKTHKGARPHSHGTAETFSPVITTSIRREIATPKIEQAANALGVTPSIIFQGAFELWLATATHSQDISFDYLLSGRNVALPDPQNINGTLANFLPVRTLIDPVKPLQEFLRLVQDDFWDMTEHGSVGLDEIYKAAEVSRDRDGNQVLFLFQPFEPTAKGDPSAKNRWLVMAQSKVRMFQPYALVVEVMKALGDRHVLKVMYDDRLYDREGVEKIADEISAIVDEMVDEEKMNMPAGQF